MIVDDRLNLGIYPNEPGLRGYRNFHWRAAFDAAYVARVDQYARRVWAITWRDQQLDVAQDLAGAILLLQDRLAVDDGAWLRSHNPCCQAITLRPADRVKHLSDLTWRQVGSSFVLHFDPLIGPSEGLLQRHGGPPEHVLVGDRRRDADLYHSLVTTSQPRSFAR